MTPEEDKALRRKNLQLLVGMVLFVLGLLVATILFFLFKNNGHYK
jgi:hypothetical protein